MWKFVHRGRQNGKMATEPFPATKHTLISWSQSKSSIFRKHPLNLMWSSGSKYVVLFYLCTLVSKQKNCCVLFGLFLCIWLARYKCIHFSACAVRVDLEWGWQDTSIAFSLLSIIAVPLPRCRGIRDLEPVLCGCVIVLPLHSLI